MSELSAGIMSGRCRHRDGTCLTARRGSKGSLKERTFKESSGGNLVYREKGVQNGKAAACLNMGQAAANSTEAAVIRATSSSSFFDKSKSKSDGWFRLVRDSVRASQPRYAEGRRVVNQAAILGAHE